MIGEVGSDQEDGEVSQAEAHLHRGEEDEGLLQLLTLPGEVVGVR